MIAGVNGVSAYARAAQVNGPTAGPIATNVSNTSFESKLGAAINSVDQAQSTGDTALDLLASGEQVDLHGTMIALEKADISLRTMVSVRDRVVAAYEQVMNMAI